ncbi:MAG: hypothetical protein U5L74_10515 [Ideonella sp.]|nr:hypothetical protein [Ideonella sp.]
MEGRAALVEMLLFYGAVLAWAGWQWWDYRRWKRTQQAQEQADKAAEHRAADERGTHPASEATQQQREP